MIIITKTMNLGYSTGKVTDFELREQGLIHTTSGFIWSAKVTLHTTSQYTRVYPKVSGLAAWSENCKW
jgi:hypothetical protein